jgi:hypothetical protein
MTAIEIPDPIGGFIGSHRGLAGVCLALTSPQEDYALGNRAYWQSAQTPIEADTGSTLSRGMPPGDIGLFEEFTAREDPR